MDQNRGNTLYLECYSGISGDMVTAALIDLGADQKVLQAALASLPVDGFSIKISRVSKAGLDTCDFQVVLQEDNHDHDMEYLHGQHGPATEGNVHDTGGQHLHRGHHSHEVHAHHGAKNGFPCEAHHHGHPHGHMHRGYAEICAMIGQADMSDAAKQTAVKIFTILGEAEAKAHGTDLGHVHFHEVGAIDSIVDIVSAAVCLDNLNITDVVIPVLCEGCGTVRCQHGILPIPVPAVANIIREHSLPLQIMQTQGEFVTPTGAAIAAAIRTEESLPKQFRITGIGLGAGKRTYERPSILRAMFIEPVSVGCGEPAAGEDVIYKLECNLDDCSGEALGYTFQQLMEAGAKDVFYMPVFMKKNRPAYQLNVICRQADIGKLEQLIFQETTTIGIRRQRMERTVLPRRMMEVQTEFGNIQVKVCELGSEVRVYPEYQSVLACCKQTGRPYFEVYHAALGGVRK